MGGTFDRWLAKPSTLCLLRRLIQSETGCAVRRGRQWPTRRQQSTGAAVQEKDEAEKTTETASPDVGPVLYRHQRRNSSRRILFMSLRSGTTLLPADVDVKDASREMEIQADVGAPDRLGQLAVDKPENMHNMSLWAEILQMRQRLHGREGLEAVWTGLRSRNVHLPLDGPEADFLWKAFIHGGIVDRELEKTVSATSLLRDVLEYAKDLRKRTGQSYPRLYKLIIGRWLRISPRMARIWHQYLVQADLATADDIMEVVPDLMQPTEQALRSQRFKFFRQCYREAIRRDMYDDFIAEALASGDQRAALRYHQFFLSHGDAPSQAFFAKQGVQSLFKLDGDRSLPMKSAKPTTPQVPATRPTEAHHPTVNREAMNTLVGDVYGIKPKALSDAFCARMFATRAFSVQLVIKGLALFGADKLGPLAMREMAVRAGSPEVFCNDLQQLKNFGVSTGDTMFALLLVKVAREGNGELWQALLESDQHPEAYDNAHTQSSLLAFYLEQQKWVVAHLSLLTASLSGAHASHQAWNRILQYYMLKHDYPATVSTFQSMQSQEVFLTSYTMQLLRSNILPRRDVSKRPRKGHGPGYFEPTTFVAKAYIYAAEQGKQVRPTQWVEVLKRLGMNHQWEQLERVVMTLLVHSNPLGEDDQWPEEDELRSQRLRTMFTSNMRKALFVWGFRSASVRNQLCEPMYEPEQASSADGAPHSKPPSVERWAQGLPLLQRLHDFGFDFPIDDVRVVFVQRMWILFGPGYSTRAINHEARRNNQLSLAHYIRHANEVWEGLIDWVKPELLESDSDARLLPEFFGEYHPASSKRHELADVKAWSEALSSGAAYIVEPRRTRQKEAAWMRSPLRIPHRPMQPSKPDLPPTKAKTADAPELRATESRSRRNTPLAEDKG